MKMRNSSFWDLTCSWISSEKILVLYLHV